MTPRRILQVTAVAFSLALGGGFVYVKAGGVIPGLPFNRPADPPRAPLVFSGSKSFSGTTAISGGSDDLQELPPQEPPILSDSKYIIVAPLPIPSEPPAVLPGFKSAVLTPPSSIVNPPHSPRLAEELQPPDTGIIYGPKSAPLIEPVVPSTPPSEPPSDSDEP